MKMRMNQIHVSQGGAAYSGSYRAAPSTVGALLGDAAAKLNLWSARRRDRRAIRHLDDHMLRDIGVDRLTAEQIGERPFWKA
jgi:uncharacterized protein YjiS (DUF1127 family)